MAAQQAEAAAAGGNLMLQMDPPDHTRYRKLVNRGFTPRMIGELETHVRELTTEILDKALAKGEGDFVVDIAAELPLEVIAELIGVPREDRHKLFEWSNRMIGSEDPEYRVSDEEAFNAQVEMFLYAQQLAEQRAGLAGRRHHHRAAERRGRRRVAVGHGLQPLLPAAVGGGQRDDPQRDRPRHERVPREPRPVATCFADDLDTHLAGATEEILRWAIAGAVLPPQRHPRTSSCTASTIKEGDKVTLWYISGNRDEDVFDDPFRVRHHPHAEPAHRVRRRRPALLPRRPAGPHGDPRAVRGAGQAGRTTSRRSATPDRLRSNFIGGIKHLPVRYHTR